MANDSFKIKKSLNIEPIAGASPSAEGDIVYDDTTNSIKYNNGSVRTIANLDEAQTLSNKTISGLSISGTTTTDLTASRALTTNGSSQLAASATTATELGYVNGVTSAIQTQLDAKVAKSTLTAKGSLLTATAASTPSELAVGTDGLFLKAQSSESTGLVWASAVANLSVVNKTTTYTATTSDDVITADATSASFTITLFTAVGNTGKVIRIKKTDSDMTKVVTIDGNGTETIDGATTTTLNTQYEEVSLVSNGTNWIILNRFYPTAEISYTPTFSAGFGTVSNAVGYWKREGSYVIIRASVTLGTVAGSLATMSLPTGITSASTFITYEICGQVARSGTSAIPSHTLIAPSATVLNFSGTGTTNAALTAYNGNDLYASSSVLSINARFPVNGWK